VFDEPLVRVGDLVVDADAEHASGEFFAGLGTDACAVVDELLGRFIAEGLEPPNVSIVVNVIPGTVKEKGDALDLGQVRLLCE
jgi:hypothetical protein